MCICYATIRNVLDLCIIYMRLERAASLTEGVKLVYYDP